MKSPSLVSLLFAVFFAALVTACGDDTGSTGPGLTPPSDTGGSGDSAAADVVLTDTSGGSDVGKDDTSGGSDVVADTGGSDVIEPSDTADTSADLIDTASDDVAVDAGPSCEDECDPGMALCDGNAYQSCELTGEGCYEWSSLSPCPTKTVCVDGACVDACMDQPCTSIGAKKCGDAATEIVTCGDYNGDGCLEWGSPLSCAAPAVCSNGLCALTCADDCTVVGAKKCEGNSIVSCAEHDGDGCLEWGGPQPCGALICSGGFCQASCTDECTQFGAKKCDGNGLSECADPDNDGCLSWGTPVNCPEGTLCSAGACAEQCKSECTSIGSKKCSQNSVVACGDYNGDGCLEWGSPLPCGAGLVCSNGFCATDCTDECTVVNAKKCDEGGQVVSCGNYDADGCLEWGSPVPCAQPLVCANGSCSLTCTDGCPVENQKSCVPGTTTQFQVCDDYNGDGCLEWGTAQTCGATLTCSGGNCTQTCSNTCQPNGSKTCQGNATTTCGDYNSDGCLEWGTPVFCNTTEECDGGTCTELPPPATVVIGEVLYDAIGSDTDTFIELAGPAGTDLTGFKLVGIDGNGGKAYVTIELSGKIASDGYYVVAHPDAQSWIGDMADTTSTSVDFQNGPDSIQLLYGAKIVDAVGYGNFAGATFAGEGSPAVDPAAGSSIGRNDKNTDTNDNSKDFVDYEAPTPATANVEVQNTPPVAKLACPGSGTVNQSLNFSAVGSSDADGEIVSYTFDFGDGTQPTSLTTATTAHTFAKGGNFTVTLTVKDDGGLGASATCVVPISASTPATVVIIKPFDGKVVTQGEVVAVLIDATAAPGTSISKVELMVDGVVAGAADTQAPYEFSYTIPNNAAVGKSIALVGKATDSAGGVGTSATHNLVVNNDKPKASFTAIVTGPLSVALDATSSSDTETPAKDLEVRWDYQNDGTWDTTWSTTKTATFTYPAEGTYTVAMEVRDAIGQISKATSQVTLSLIQYVSGTVNTTTWSGTIVITGDVTVPSGQTLTIAEGTQVLFVAFDQDKNGVGDYDITINGGLVVSGKAENPVLFSVFGTDGKKTAAWGNIALAGTATVQHAVVEYGNDGFLVTKNATVSDTTLRFCKNGIRIPSGNPTLTLTKVALLSNTDAGLVAQNSSITNAVSLEVKENAKRGIYVTGEATVNVSKSVISANGGPGFEFYSSGNGLITQNQIVGNQREGIRLLIESNAKHPVINYNNIYDNAKGGAMVTAKISLAASSTDGQTGTKTSTSYATPTGEVIEWVFAAYQENDSSSNYVMGTVANSSGGGALLSYSSAGSGWYQIDSYNAKSIQLSVTDNSSFYGGSISATWVAYVSKSAKKEISVISDVANIDLRHNWWGVFPDVVPALAIGPNLPNIQGFIGVLFDGTFTKGPYFGGENLAQDTIWQGTVYLTGVLTVPSGKTLTAAPGALVNMVPTDIDENGVGDSQLTVAGTIDFVGSPASPILITPLGTPKKTSGFSEVKFESTAKGTVSHTIVEYGKVGVRVLSTAGMVFDNFTSRYNNNEGIICSNAKTVQFKNIVVEDNKADGMQVSGSSSVSIDGAMITANKKNGVRYDNSTTTLSLKNATITTNTQSGVYLVASNVTVDHNNISSNGFGVFYDGASNGTLTYCNIKYNNLEGILLAAAGPNNPSPVINNNNIYGNSVVEGGVLVNPGVSATSTDGQTGTKTSSTWSTPAAQWVQYVRVQYNENDSSSNYVTGSVSKMPAGTMVLNYSSVYGATFVSLIDSNVTSFNASVNDNSSFYGGTMTVSQVYYRVKGQSTEMTAVTDKNTVNVKSNYWGVFPDVLAKMALGRTDAVDISGFVGIEVSGTGPQ
ncbi:MAG: right-handed parallel beta-helix repeat-containing protein [Myxococcales bacterium]|nr:right-handed parallel beta-helix repeat-containing protein [Myxococcales bacterium]